MAFMILLLILCVVFLIFMVKGTMEEHKKEEKYREYLRTQYGAYREKSYTENDFHRIAKRYEYQKKEEKSDDFSYIDDITWNDLELGRIFSKINVTQSAAGEEYLYMLLRRPRLKAEELVKLENDICYYDREEARRLEIQKACRALGSTGKYSIYDYIEYMAKAHKESILPDVLQCIAFWAALALIFFSAQAGLFCFLAIVCFNVFTYLNKKRHILPYMTSVAYIRRLLEIAAALRKAQAVPDEMGEIAEMVGNAEKKFLKFKRQALWVYGSNQATGNPLQLVMDYVKMFTHIDLIMYRFMLEELQNLKADILSLLEAVGYLDSIIAIASFRKSLKIWSVPQFVTERKLEIVEGIHPLIQDAVPNTITAQKGVLITGSNASGKSTFLKMTAINAVLAQTIHTVAAKEYTGNFYRIYSSMSLRDSLESGDSYYMVEIKSLKRIMDAINNADSDEKVLCFVDEVLRGTNTVERIAASTQILCQLAAEKVLCFAATHDIELTYLLENVYDNYHFTEELCGSQIVFSYKMLSGRSKTRNAIKLLKEIGFDEEVTQKAEILAERFLQTNKWEKQEEIKER